MLATTDAIGLAIRKKPSWNGETLISWVRNSEPNGSANAIDTPDTTLMTESWRKVRDRSGEDVLSLSAVTPQWCWLIRESGNQLSHYAGNISHNDDSTVAAVICTTPEQA
ncbi:hypothetical protein GCM10017774_07840 [Lentzea cavernae]|uniref:Uncharacterized protein n=1 Tax=Lentzea cavernae TaxID=2020703 RepID=A0ABQ3M2P9_9PSEU|nr:hypothetical protein GCM10017774_07840 [Lentzea cavernae]